ncbi:MAG: indole-3-glycerol phosphate synthase TrpC [Planctomycetota bacterium]
MTILDDILVKTRETIAREASQVSSTELERRIVDAPPCLDFCGALAATDKVRVIAEVKRASPSAGEIRADFQPVQIAEAYVAGGAACLSVLTDEPFFRGSLDYLRAIRQAVDVPLLRKDFIIDTYQLLQARDAGADAVLLIAECLSAAELSRLEQQARELGMQTLIELYEPENLDAVLATKTTMVGVNNRDLRTFHTDLLHTVRVADSIPNDRLIVGESGIRTHQDLATLQEAGVKGVLVGESLMRQDDVAAALLRLRGVAGTPL